jgi:hypothetical protein
LLRNLFSDANDTVGKLVRVLRESGCLLFILWALLTIVLAFAALLAFWPSAFLGVGTSGTGLCPGRYAAAFAAHLGGKIGAAGYPLVTALRAFHPATLSA